MKLSQLFETQWTQWNHSSEFETHYEKAIETWMKENVVPRMRNDVKLYYCHAAHNMDKNMYLIGLATRKVPKGTGGTVMRVFPSVIQKLFNDNDYEVGIDSVGVHFDGHPKIGITVEDFLEEMQLVEMDLSKLHDDPEIAAKLRARMKKESMDDDDARWDAKMDAAEDAKREWRKGLFKQAEDALKNLRIPASWFVHYDLDETDPDEPCMIFWAVDTGEEHGGGYSDIGDLEDALMRTDDDPEKKHPLPTDYPHMSAAPVDGDYLMIGNIAADLDMPDMDISALHDDPEIAEKLRKKQEELRKKRLGK